MRCSASASLLVYRAAFWRASLVHAPYTPRFPSIGSPRMSGTLLAFGRVLRFLAPMPNKSLMPMTFPPAGQGSLFGSGRLRSIRTLFCCSRSWHSSIVRPNQHIASCSGLWFSDRWLSLARFGLVSCDSLPLLEALQVLAFVGRIHGRMAGRFPCHQNSRH
jgi:hypothetical protein